MNTPAHLVLAAAAFARRHERPRNAVVFVGAFLPDASLYGMVAINGFVRDMPPEQIFGESYYHPFWQSVFAVDTSFLVWGAVLIFGFLLKSILLKVFAGAGLLHLALDFPLHHDDGRAHFWPASDWIFESPLSYWDPSAYGWLIAPLEIAICLVLMAVLWRRFQGTPARVTIALTSVALLAPAILFAVMLG